MKSWQVQEAKARFSALVHSVETDGPQTIFTATGVDLLNPWKD